MKYLLNTISRYCRVYRGLSRLSWRGILLTFIESTLCGVFYYLSYYFVHDLHLPVSQAGMIISCYGIGAILGGLVGGKLSDKTSPHFVSIGSLILQGIGYFALIEISNLYLLMINVFMLGMATYGFITSNYVWTLAQCSQNEPEKLKAINLLATASNLGLGLSAMIVSVLVYFGFHFIFMMTSTLIFILAIYLVVKENHQRKITLTQNQPIEERKEQPQISVEQIKKYKIVTWVVLFCVLFTGATVAQLSTTYSLFIQSEFPSWGVQGVSLLFAINSFLVVFFETPMGSFLSDYNKLLMVGVGAFFIGTGMGMLSIANVFAMAIVACVIYTIGEMIFFSMAQLVCYQKGAAQKKGQSMGTYRMVYATSRFIGPIAGGYVFQHIGGHVLWVFSGVIGVICLGVSYYFRKYN
ncbi:MAG: hypothetical protein A3F12_04205 [Gammaproteobacteria bacterium RIFCSPHIGHO2_12_FULL_38_14]|nr:MAG: hypothetical protein A3F12_04205 [Gammaproteobacteria bacterium RIFCSPHIGHO2_12_FULL_38_14]